MPLLTPGWAGILTLPEARHLQNEIKQDSRLRRKWGFTSARKTFPLQEIARRAYPEDPVAAQKNITSLLKKEATGKAQNRSSAQN